MAAAKAAARPITERDRLRHAVPGIDRLFDQWATRGDAGVAQLRRLLDLLDEYGATAVAAAVEEALTREELLDQQRDCRELGHVFLARAGERGLGEFFEQRVRLAVDDAVTLLDRRSADRLRERALAGPGGAEKQHVLSVRD